MPPKKQRYFSPDQYHDFLSFFEFPISKECIDSTVLILSCSRLLLLLLSQITVHTVQAAAA
jgi:hypothetical protein